jgi:uncharacterized membrane protein (UPF0127 family)
MNAHAALLVGALVLLGGCIGGIGDIGGTGDLVAGDEGQETTLPATTDVDQNVTATFVVEDGENVTVTLRVADESEERRKGLMYRQSLANRSGMIFVYDDAAPRTFWMKNTYVALDIIFVASNGTVLNVEHAQPQPNASDSEVDRYSSDGDATYVVELPRGFANETGVGPGTQLVFNGTVPEAGPGTATPTEDDG